MVRIAQLGNSSAIRRMVELFPFVQFEPFPSYLCFDYDSPYHFDGPHALVRICFFSMHLSEF